MQIMSPGLELPVFDFLYDMNTLKIYLDDELLRENLLVVNSRILMANITPIKIFVTKNSAQFSSESIDIAIEYLHAAYIGERLSKVAIR